MFHAKMRLSLRGWLQVSLLDCLRYAAGSVELVRLDVSRQFSTSAQLEHIRDICMILRGVLEAEELDVEHMSRF